MAEYIEREAAQTSCRKYSFAESYDAFAVDCILKAIPSADVAPVRHGQWIYDKKAQRPYCSVCKGYFYGATNSPMSYCPNCGAKMDG